MDSATSSYNYLPVDPGGRITQGLLCVECNRELSGENVNDVCPDCKTVISESVIGRAVCHVNSSGQLDESIVCKSCGYTLRGLLPEGLCPECGAPIGYSLEVNLLRYCSFRWLNGIKNGFTLYIITSLLSVLMGIIAAIISAITQNQAMQILINAAIGSIAGILTIIAIFQITAPDPEHISTHSLPSGLRIVARLSVVLLLCSQVATSLGVLNLTIAPYLAIPAGLIGMVVFATVFSYARRLAFLIPDDKLAGQTKVMVWLYICFAVLATVGGVIVLLAGVSAMGQPPAGGGQGLPPGVSMPLLITGGLFSCTGALAMLGVFVWSLIIMFKFRKHFAEVARIASQTQMQGVVMPHAQNHQYG